MKRIFLTLAAVAVLGTTFVSCRDTKKETIEVEVTDDADDVADDIEDAIDDAGDAIEDAADDVEDAITGEDDN
ncbi:hypothetical protein ULMS_23910 [Patiriisocius marinistellae]|uniref:Uncharacterized protein n=1 Tax=Patiriisocius marinistellae TaxID=2494560 RepID=A0A5J4FXW2_9FLAO|nr:hypothetical protein [Patiriisocius marinistellae]GEQ86883.1 hypothetical protein ULMS_23910 [Patiriisocius marinistellae]